MLNEVILNVTDTNGNTVSLDLYENEKLYYNFHFTDLTDFSSVSSYSREFRIPASETNKTFFGAIENVNLDGWFDFRKKVPASLTSATIPIASGYIQVKNVYWSNGNIYEYNLVFFGEVANLAKSIGEKKFRDISTIANGSLDYDNIYSNVPSPSSNIILTLCDKYGFTISSTTNNGVPVLNSSIPLKVGHLTPAVSAYYLFDKILSDAGITWVSDNLGEVLDSVYIPWFNSQYPNATQGLNDNASQLAYSSDVSSISFTPSANIYNFYTNLSEYEDTGSNWSSGIFTAPYTAQYTFNINLFAQLTSSTVSSADFYKCKIIPFVNDVAQSSTESFLGDLYAFNQDIQVAMNDGDTLKLKVYIQGYTDAALPINTTWKFLGSGLNPNSCYVLLTNVSSSLVGDAYLMKYNAPDMKQIDFIKSIQQMFNLVFVPDKTYPNIIRVEPMVDYLASGNSLDWSNTLDISKDVNIYPTTDMQSKNVTFTYASDSDVCNKFFTDNGRIYGSYQITEKDFDVINDFATGETKVELSFASTPANAIETSNIIVPKFINDSFQFVLGKPRILYNAGYVKVYLYNEATNVNVLTDVYVLNNYSAVNANVDNLDLNFAPETPLHNIIANPYNNLYNRFYRNYYHELYDGQARVMEAFFKLSVSDVLALGFDDKIWIIDSWWRVLDVEGYTVGEFESTKVKLMRIIDLDNTCQIHPTTSNLDGSLNWVTNDTGSSVSATEDCCRRFTYFWNADKGKCYSKPNNGTINLVSSGKPSKDIKEIGGVIAVNGSFANPVKGVNAHHVVQLTEKNIIVSGLSADANIYLPSATIAKGQSFVIKNIDDTYKVNVQAVTGEKIDNVVTKTLPFTGDSVTLVSDGSNWIIESEDSNIAVWTIDCMTALSVDVYAPYALIIWSKENVKNSPTVTIQQNGTTYTLGSAVAEGDKLTITASTASVFNLIIEQQW